MQPVDFTTLTAACAELRDRMLPARLEQVYQRDRHNIALALRTLKGRSWLNICWHPQGAHICLGTHNDHRRKIPDTFTFSDQLRHQLNGLAWVAIEPVAPWERALDLQFAKRPGEPALWHLYVEIMGKYSNVILTNQQNQIVTAAHQVSEEKSSVRPILTGQPYSLPPALTNPIPNLSESPQRWQERVGLVPGQLWRQLLKCYRGLSPTLVKSMVTAAGLEPNQPTDTLTDVEWQQLWKCWQFWLQTLETAQFHPGWTKEGYTLMGWGATAPVPSTHELLAQYYTSQLNRQEFTQLRHQLLRQLAQLLEKQRQKALTFSERLQQSDNADEYRQLADLLMAYLQEWQPGMTSISLCDFQTNQPITIPLDPEKNAVGNAQSLYKRHQKLKRARSAVEPLFNQVKAEIEYLELVKATLWQLDSYEAKEDLQTIAEIREELIDQGYLDRGPRHAPGPLRCHTDVSVPYRFQTPSGFELLIGRNNRQNDHLAFRIANDYDLWFHTQEIPGSHVLMRLQPGKLPDDVDLQFAADLAGYYSQGRQSDRVPVVYTAPKHVYKPKGAKPGMVIYKQETVLWGRPQQAIFDTYRSGKIERIPYPSRDAQRIARPEVRIGTAKKQ
ncbi:MAG: NFACT family protein, partial [Hormoscilla sp. SP12CHS1]|nr:NFACT family protein [Hormoscilla sp. SP12CHS1]